MKQTKLIVMCGFPASGKSYWIDKHKKNYTVVELDWIRNNIFGHQFHRNAEFFVIGMARSMVKMLLSQDKNVIVDATALTETIRRDWINIGKEFNTKTSIVWINTPFITCVKRNKKRKEGKIVPLDTMMSMQNMFDPPRQTQFLHENIKVIEIKK